MSTVSAAPGAVVRVERLAASLARINHLVALRIFLGAVFITVFFENLVFTRFTPEGYAKLIDRYAARTAAPDFWSSGVMGFFSDNAAIFSKVQAVTEMTFGVALVIGVATGFLGLAVTLFLLGLWLSELGLFWIWELLGLIFVALAVGIGNLPHMLRGSARERLLGPPSSTSWPLWRRLALAPIGGLALFLLIDVARTGADKNSTVALGGGLVFGGALLVLALLDELRRRPTASAEDPPATPAS